MKRILLSALTLSLVVTGLAVAQDWPLAVRIHSYGKFQDVAMTHLQELGVKYIFISVPEVDQVDATMAELKRHDLTPIVMRGDSDLSEETFVYYLTPQLEICGKMGAKYMFLSAKRDFTPREVAYKRLREAGEVAKEHGVTIVLETHPDLGTNGAVQVETMKAINHPNVQVNFDTANITYYNKNTSAVAELKKSIDYVSTVEFKDHNGEFETWVFPVLGRGVVDFPTIVDMLRGADYKGPITLEFEGTKGVELDEAATKEAIAGCVAEARALLAAE